MPNLMTRAWHEKQRHRVDIDLRARICGSRAWYIFRNDGACLHTRVMRTLSCPGLEPLRPNRFGAVFSLEKWRHARPSANETANDNGAVARTRETTMTPAVAWVPAWFTLKSGP
jgi:hypothetical protein